MGMLELQRTSTETLRAYTLRLSLGHVRVATLQFLQFLLEHPQLSLGHVRVATTLPVSCTLTNSQLSLGHVRVATTHVCHVCLG